MSVADFITKLRRLDVRLKLNGDNLHVSAPQATLTDAMRTELSVRKPEIIRYLQEAARESAGRLPLANSGAENNAPLSFGQRRLWFLDQLSHGGTAYCIPGAVRLTGLLDRSSLCRSLDSIVERHAILRTTFHEDEGNVVQVIGDSKGLPLEEHDLRDMPENVRNDEVVRHIGEESRRKFDLEIGPLVRGVILQVSAEEHVLILNFHHIVADGWSFAVIVRELSELYDAYTHGRDSPLEPLPMQYADFAAWQQESLQKDSLADQLDYWRDCLHGELPVLNLPFARPRPAVQRYAAAAESFELSQELSDALYKLSREARVTPFMTLLTAFKVLLYRYTGEPDVLVGTPIANRRRTELDGMVGFFLNTLVLRTNLSGNPTMRELLSKVRGVTVGAYSNQDMPFEELVAKLNPKRSTSHAPLCQTMFVLQNAPAEPVRLAQLDIELMDVESVSSEYDFDIQMLETTKGLRGYIRYSLDLYDAQDIRRFIRHFIQLLKAIVRDPECSVLQMPLLTEEEQQQIENWNFSPRQFQKSTTVIDLFERQVHAHPNALAVSCGQRQLSYADLNNLASQTAQVLLGAGISPGNVVGLSVDRSVEMIVGFLGILKAGGAYLPLDPVNPIERLAYMIDDASTSVVLTDGHNEDRFKDVAVEVIVIDTSNAIKREPLRPPPITGDNLAYVIFTSGSTGKPKGVEIQHAALANLVDWHTREYKVKSGARASQLAGMAFDACTWEIWPYLTTGASLHIPTSEVHTPDQILTWLSDSEIDIAFMPTPLAEQVLRANIPADLSLKTLLTGGDKLHPLPQIELPFTLVNHYGPTENTVVSTAAIVDSSDTKPPPIGRPIQNVKAYVLDQAMSPVPVGIIGELYLGGDSLARGYRNHPELTATYFVPDHSSSDARARLYRTGDLVRWLADGNLEFVGRADSQVKIRGFRIELSEIETVLAAYAGVAEAVVQARDDGSGESRLAAYIVSIQGKSLCINDLKAHVRSKLPEYMVPSAYVKLEELPLTANGKIDHRALPMPDRSHSSDRDFAPPQSDAERLLASIWCDVLHLEVVGVHDNFFDLGGSSLSIVSVEAKMRQEFGRRIPLVEFFRQPTIAELATFLTGTEKGPDDAVKNVQVRVAKQNAALARNAALRSHTGKPQNDEDR